jgi:hypothetical protein
MTAEERAVNIVTLFEQAREHALEGDLLGAIERGTEAVFLARQAEEERRDESLRD